MRILGIDSSAPGCSVALLNGGTLVSERVAEPHPSYSKYLLQMVDQVLKEGGVRLNELDGFAVTVGPGSFTGLRIGVSLIKGFVLATEKPFVGVNSLEALAATVDSPDLPVCAAMDARKGEVYAAVFEPASDGLRSIIPEQALSPEAWCERIQGPALFIGGGVEHYEQLFKESLGTRFQVPADPSLYSVAAGAVQLALPRFSTESHFDLNQLKINYIRKSEAELSLAGSLAERRVKHGD